MADNTQVAGGSGDTIRDIDRTTAKTQVVALDGGGAATERLVNPLAGLPVEDVGRVEGFSQIELLSQILLELRIMNQQLHALPQTLGDGINGDEPSRFRLEPSALAS